MCNLRWICWPENKSQLSWREWKNEMKFLCYSWNKKFAPEEVKSPITRGVRELENIGMSREEVGFPKESGFPTKSRFSKISRTRLPFLELLYNAVYQPTKSVSTQFNFFCLSEVIGNTDSKNHVTWCIRTCDCVLSTWTLCTLLSSIAEKFGKLRRVFQNPCEFHED